MISLSVMYQTQANTCIVCSIETVELQTVKMKNQGLNHTRGDVNHP